MTDETETPRTVQPTSAPVLCEPGTTSVSTTPKRVAVYVFAWDPKRRQTMLDELKLYAKTRGYVVVKIYLDSTKACPNLRRLVADAKNGSFEIVLVRWVINLGIRSRLDGLRRARELDGVGVRVESVGEPWFDVHLEPLEWILEDEKRRHEKSLRALKAKQERGEPTGTPALGYQRGDDGVLEEDPHEQEAIARAIELREQDWSYSAIAAELTRLGYRTRSDTPITHVWVARVLRRAGIA